MLSKLAVWYLRKKKISVLIGFEVKNGQMKSYNQTCALFDNELYNVEYKTRDNKPFLIPDGKFSIERENKTI